MSRVVRQVPPRRLADQPQKSCAVLRGLFTTNTDNSLLRLRARAAHCAHALALRVPRGAYFHLPLPRSKPCIMAQEPSLTTANPGRRRHSMLAPGGGHRIVPTRSALKTRKETMRGISPSPRRKPSPAIRLERRTITSTPSIFSDRCRRTAKRHSDPVAGTAGGTIPPTQQ